MYRSNKSVFYYSASAIVGAVGFTYAMIPLYKLLCRETGFGGQVKEKPDFDSFKDMKAKERQIKVSFDSTVSKKLPWSFNPLQRSVNVTVGKGSLCFFNACNNSDEPIVGFSTYNVVPYKAAQYFNKIQCFCFEEQKLNPRESVDMPVYFFIDPEFADDFRMDDVDEIVLSYTFHKARD